MGNDDREKSYFLRMYLSCYRAAQYLSERPEWDGKNLVVIGTSQGGQQSIVTAGMHPKISAMLAMVPGGCDITAPTLGRAAGFPDWAKIVLLTDQPGGLLPTIRSRCQILRFSPLDNAVVRRELTSRG